MTRLQRIAFSTTAMAFTTFLGASLSAQQPQPTADPSVPQLRLEQRDTKTAGTTLEGELVQVDTTAKMLTIKTEDGKTERIRYNDATKVTGAQMADLLSAAGELPAEAKGLIQTLIENKRLEWARYRAQVTDFAMMMNGKMRPG